MRNLKYIVSGVLLLVFFVGCTATTSNVMLGELYPKVYKKHAKSILVLPAKNTTTSVDATEHFRYTITQALSERGYYVFPVHLVDSFFKSENITEAEMIRQIPIEKLKEIFNPDAILYVDINAWDTGYQVISSNVDVGLSFSLIDTTTEEELWHTNAYAYSRSASGGGGLIGLIVSAIAAAINTGVDYTKLATFANAAGVSVLPYGLYHPKYKKDISRNISFIDVTKLKDGKLYVDDYFMYGNKKEGKVALTSRGHLEGYQAFSFLNYNGFHHNGYQNYYLTQNIKGRKYLKNRFFLYENNRPFLLSNSQKVFVTTLEDGTIPSSEDDDGHYFSIESIVALTPVQVVKK